MARRACALVVSLNEAAELLLTKTSYIRREIRDGAIKAVRLGNQTVIRKDELKSYLERKEAEGVPARKSSRCKEVSTPERVASALVNEDLIEMSIEDEPEVRFDGCSENQKETADEDE